MAKAKKQDCKKEIIIRECMGADQVLPPERGLAVGAPVVTLRCDGACVHLDEHADTASVALVLATGWNRAQAGLVEIIRFGATLLAVREWLDREDEDARRRAISAGERPDNLMPGGWNKGTGLKAWLETNCPEINYKTAYGYMCAAAGLRREAKLADDVPLLVMMGEDPVPEARAEKLRKRVQRILSESTLGLLREAATAQHDQDGKGGGDRRSGQTQTEEEKHGAMVKAANAVWNANVDALVDNVKRLESHLLLTGETVGKLMHKLGIVTDALKDAANKD